MQSIINLIFDHAPHAHYIVFTALILAGFNFPISEDLLIIICGILASSIVPENTYKIFIFVFLGCYISDNISYWLGRILRKKLSKFKWFFNKKKLNKAQMYYEKHGGKTLFFGRFIPFGIRNFLFITAGMGKMHYGRFLMSDGFACLFSNITLFTLTYHLGKNYQEICVWLKTFHLLFFSIFILSFTILIFLYKKRKAQKSCRNI
jgi:membrane protein DedA with SNARE-associated domain